VAGGRWLVAGGWWPIFIEKRRNTMSSSTIVENVEMASAESRSFDRFAGIAAIVAGAAGFLYSIAFVVLKDQLTYSLCLMVGGLATTVVMVALYQQLREIEPGVAQLGLLLGVVAVLGSVIHAGYDLGNAINPPATTNVDLPSQIDPRGMLTFGIAGLALFAFSWLMSKSGRFSRPLAYLGYLLAVLLIVIYLGRLVILDANSPAVLWPAALTGLIVNPLWYILLGLSLLKSVRQ
jgi:hypothetical protein